MGNLLFGGGVRPSNILYNGKEVQTVKLDGYHYKDIVSKVMQQVSLNSGISKLALAPNGYVVFGNGLTIMWGQHENPVVFPISFKSQCLQVVPQLQAPNDNGNMSKNRVAVTGLSNTGFSLVHPQNTYRYIAIGC